MRGSHHARLVQRRGRAGAACVEKWRVNYWLRVENEGGEGGRGSLGGEWGRGPQLTSDWFVRSCVLTSQLCPPGQTGS